jgi:hypothetical protein
MNELDSELVAGAACAPWATPSPEPEAAQVILYNTCSVREQAEQKVWSRLGELTSRKKPDPALVVGVLGCLAERDGVGPDATACPWSMSCAARASSTSCRRCSTTPCAPGEPRRRDRRGRPALRPAGRPAGQHQPPERDARRRRGLAGTARPLPLRLAGGPPATGGPSVGLCAHHPRLQQVLHLLRRPLHPRRRDPPPARPHHRRVQTARRRRRHRGHAARPDRQPLPLRARRGRRHQRHHPAAEGPDLQGQPRPRAAIRSRASTRPPSPTSSPASTTKCRRSSASASSPATRATSATTCSRSSATIPASAATCTSPPSPADPTASSPR